MLDRKNRVVRLDWQHLSVDASLTLNQVISVHYRHMDKSEHLANFLMDLFHFLLKKANANEIVSCLEKGQTLQNTEIKGFKKWYAFFSALCTELDELLNGARKVLFKVGGQQKKCHCDFPRQANGSNFSWEHCLKARNMNTAEFQRPW